MNRRFSTAAISAATALTVTFAGISPVTAAPAAADTANTQTQPGSSSKNNQTPDLGKDEFGNPYRDYSKSSIDPLVESLSSGSSQRWGKVTDEDYAKWWNSAMRSGLVRPILDNIYDLQFEYDKRDEEARLAADAASKASGGPGVSKSDWRLNKNNVRGMYAEDRDPINGVQEGDENQSNLPKNVAENETANKVLGSSLKRDAARQQAMGVTFEVLLAGGIIAIIAAACSALVGSGVIKLPQF